MHAETLLDASDADSAAVAVDGMVAAQSRPQPRQHPIDVYEKIDRLIMLIDRALTEQVNAIMHHPRFQAMEARWRGLAYTVATASEAPDVQVKLISVSWPELCRDLEKATDFDQSHLFDLVYNREFGMAGGEPFGILLGDYRVCHGINPEFGTDDVAAMRFIAGVAAASFAPFLLEARPELLELDSFCDLDLLPEMTHIFESLAFVRWQSLRGIEDSRFLGLLAPRVLIRTPLRPYDRTRIDGFQFEEKITAAGTELLWASPIYAFSRVVVRAFTQSGWFADLRGAPQDADGGGLVTDLPTMHFSTDRPGLAAQPPVEIRLTAAQERAFSDHGLIPVGYAPSTPWLVFNANPSLHRPMRTTSRIADENARIAAMLQYVLCASRFAHFLKVMMRDKVGSLGGPADIEKMIDDWLQRHCLGNDDAPNELKAKFPLRAASVSVREMPGRPGVLGCVLRLQPHFQLDDVSASFQLVAEVSTFSEV
jgi:type VI secretion system protein ImpD